MELNRELLEVTACVLAPWVPRLASEERHRGQRRAGERLTETETQERKDKAKVEGGIDSEEHTQPAPGVLTAA